MGNIPERNIDSNNWKGHEEIINQIFSSYKEKLTH